MIMRIFASLYVTVLSVITVSAQAASLDAVPPVSIVDGKAIFLWGGLNWAVPKELLDYFPISLTRDSEITIDAGYIFADGYFVPFYRNHDLALEVHIRKIDNEDPKISYNTLQRIGARFEKEASLNSLNLNGMTYLGSSAGIHYFQMSGENAYVQCNVNTPDPRNPPTLSNDVSKKTFYCGTTFSLPSGLYVWMRSPYIRLQDVSSVFLATRNEILSYIH